MDLPPPLPELSLVAHTWTVSHVNYDPELYDLDAPYQRGSVWDTERQANLIRSLLMGLPIGATIVSALEDRNRVVDGQQRIRAIRAFFADELETPREWWHPRDLEDPSNLDPVSWSSLSRPGQRRFSGRSFPSMEFRPQVEYIRGPDGELSQRDRSDEEILQAEADLYLLVNFGGVAQTDTDRARAEEVATPTRTAAGEPLTEPGSSPFRPVRRPH